jgi:hypothetical protein
MEITRRDDRVKQGKSAILKFHNHALESGQSRLDFDQV